jgi:voltage-gated potassium channel
MENKNHLTFLDLLVTLLSIYVLIALAVETIFTLPLQIGRLLSFIDDGICLVFIYDFVVRFRKAPSKKQFMKWGWIDLISSIPTYSYLHYGRLIRLVRLLRILRAFRSVKCLISHLFQVRIKGTLATVCMLAFLMVIFSSIAILQVEHAPNSNICTAGDALWWSFTTITTVGYGDKFPVTIAGRVIAAFLMITGIGLFGTFTAFVTSWFMTDKERNNPKEGDE